MNLASTIKLCDTKEKCSILSKKIITEVNEIEKHVSCDPGGRGTNHLFVEGDFLKSVLALSHANSVALITGFPCRLGHDPPDETDGLPGILSLKRMLQACGKQVTIFTDRSFFRLYSNICQQLNNKGVLEHSNKQLVIYDDAGSLLLPSGKPRYDVVLASERSGRAKDGRYYSMKGRDISAPLDPIDDLFQAAKESDNIITIGIGDGGNEMGMGKVYDKVVQNIPRGEKIGCTVAADLLIAAGVSNWGCQGLSLGLLAVRKCPQHQNFLRYNGVKLVDQTILEQSATDLEHDRAILEAVESFGVRDGIKPEQDMSVDGFKFDEEHTNVINKMRSIAFSQ